MNPKNDERVSKNNEKYFSLDFSNITDTGLKSLTKKFNATSEKVVEVVASNKATKKNREQQKKAVFVFENGQSVTIWVNESGHIFQVKLNSTILPVSNFKTEAAFCKEVAAKMVANQPKFDKAMARKAAAAVKAEKAKVKTARKTMDQQITELSSSIALAQQALKSDKEKFSVVQVKHDDVSSELEKLKVLFDAQSIEESNLIDQINECEGDK